jgi:hypothetical protein
MKKVVALFLLLIFCVYTFTFKTHYCYHADNGTRFHGDCQQDKKDAAKKCTLGSTNFFPLHYICYDFAKNEISQKEKAIVFKAFLSYIFHLPFQVTITQPQQVVGNWVAPKFQCRGVPLIIPHSLRGPPIV